MLKHPWVGPLLTSTLCSCLFVSVIGCESGDPNKGWSQFSRCMVGDGIGAPSEVSARIRLVELVERHPSKEWDPKTQWPGRCAPYADDLVKNLGSDGEHEMLKRELHAQLGCKADEDAPGCTFSANGEILPASVKLWETAARAKLQVDPAAQVELPKYDVQLQTADSWATLGGPDYEIGDRLVTDAGTVRLLLKSRKGAHLICDIGAKVNCSEVSKEAPAVAYQSVKLVRDEAPILSGLTEAGRQGFLADTGESVTFRGTPPNAARDGVVVEQGEEGKGFLAVSMVKGKAKGEAAFQPEQAEKVQPIGVREFVSWTEGKEGELQWRFATVAGKKLKEVASFSGEFAGFLHPCAIGDGAAVGIWGRGQGEHEAKPTKGDDTAVAVSFLKDGKWTKPVTEVMPFRRKITASRCAANQVQVSWASSEGEELEVGQISCTPEACTRVSSKWSSFGAKRWLAAGPVGSEFVALWTTELGDTRMRHGDLANFAAGTEASLFEDPSRGGPVFRDAVSHFTPHGGYLVVTDKAPTVLQLLPSGTVQALSDK